VKFESLTEYNTIKKYIDEKNWRAPVYEHAINLVVLICIVVILGAIIEDVCANEYIGGVSGTVKAYTADEKGKLSYVADLPRGIKVETTGGIIDEFAGVELDDIDELTKAGLDEQKNQIIYLPIKNIVNSKRDVVQEKEVYVRTNAVVYASGDGPELTGCVKKGVELKIIEIGKLQDSGYIDQYKVEFPMKDGDSQEGYIYGKYVVGTEEEAKENYNLHGEYDTARKAEYGFDLGGGHAKNLDYYPVEKPAFKDNEFCSNARTMYLNAYAAVHPKAYVDLIEETDCNAVVMDIKDGMLAYQSEVAKEISPRSYKSAYATVDEYKAGVDAYKEAGVYTIGRIVVFNDSLYAKDHPEDCIKYGSSRSWPSAYSRAVWEYNVKLAIEAVETFGFNEIQFDYVRFPESSYEMSQDKSTDFNNVLNEEKAQAIQGFCFYACDQIHKHGAYVSVDVFGECSYSYVTAYGQYWPAISNVVDAVSSMPYSDHHGTNDTWTHPYATLNAWAKRTAQRQKEIPTPAVDRTWITGYNTPYWNPVVTYDSKIMKQQIKALTDAGLNGGFIPWNVLSDIEKYRSYKAIWNE